MSVQSLRAFLTASLLAMALVPTEATAQGSSGEPRSEEAAASAVGGPLRHVVILTLAEGAPDDLVGTLTDAFRHLKGLPSVLAFEHGAVAGDADRRHAFVFTFEDGAALAAYEAHPDHQAFSEMAGGLGIVEGVQVIDYVAQE